MLNKFLIAYVLIFVVILFTSSLYGQDKPSDFYCRVTRITDGDTFHCNANGVDTTIRLLAANTPETTRGHDDCYGKEATAYLATLILDKDVILKFEGDKPTRGVFGRTLAYVFTGNSYEVRNMVNLKLILFGFAKDYTRKYPTKGYSPNLFHEAEDFAKKNNLGLWGSCEVSHE